MKKVYFDVTDIVEYAKSNARVSGIQRVQARAISALAGKYGDGQIRCTFFNAETLKMFEFGASAVFRGSEFDSSLLLFRLGLLSGGRLPMKPEVKRYLQPYGHRKIYRGFKKASLYATAVLSPDKLKGMGFTAFRPPVGESQVQMTEIEGLNQGDAFVFLGSNWSFPDVLRFGRAHFDQGGHVVQMIYDLIPYKSPEYCTAGLVQHFVEFLRKTPTYSSSFLAISDWSKKDLKDFLDEVGESRDIHTVPLAHEFDGFERNEVNTIPSDKKLMGLSADRFVLCVGTIEVRKNGLALLHAWERLLSEKDIDLPQLIFAGKYGWKIAAFLAKLESNPALKEKVTILSSPSDRDLAFLYQKSLFTIYPSIYEGWGLPVGESAWFGRYVISSSATSLPEVCGELVDYVDPNDIGDICDKVIFALKNPSHVAEVEGRIRSAKLRTWDDVAECIMQNVLKESSV